MVLLEHIYRSHILMPTY
ncbi:hypothetical protein F383_39082 [Gossypium arboreum]|uniref:Uncharacterized protein n=1 Tax=Gossypium arboreum TaxID=29729 RepID=A0A0B0MN03_GOSAR|nr:hypothetical protein F383_39082 [Gossypium arboreum]